MDHCHECGQDQKYDDAATLCATIIQVEATTDEERILAEQARTYLRDYITYRHSHMTSLRMPKI